MSIWFVLLWLAIGTAVGIFAAALLAAASKASDQEERSYGEWDEADDMCPNCVTPWKCNGPHEFQNTRAASRGEE